MTARFERLYAAHARAVLGYALRRTAEPEDAADVVAETFVVALRRLDDVPAEPQARAWLYAVARRTLANQRRGRDRRTRLGERLRHDLRATLPDPADDVALAADARRALDALSASEREVLELAAWEGLEPREIAEVLDISAAAARQRLSRARAALRHTDLLASVPLRDQEPR
ncbi:RNA polymerase sigma factor [Nocardioides sp.]|uniref:RNA polymerase sigma factor n=1 Tax=Nocardioides sp. TaxID=35761 RepID=UPI00271AADCF|nr:sigma-70 family RNA polymerase sigma factor [Nocardioides sp.]MDO9456559.1 sigma-70 family RNA polymerase sigma factor [Nocardioides sp.]